MYLVSAIPTVSTDFPGRFHYSSVTPIPTCSTVIFPVFLSYTSCKFTELILSHHEKKNSSFASSPSLCASPYRAGLLLVQASLLSTFNFSSSLQLLATASYTGLSLVKQSRYSTHTYTQPALYASAIHRYIYAYRMTSSVASFI